MVFDEDLKVGQEASHERGTLLIEGPARTMPKVGEGVEFAAGLKDSRSKTWLECSE